MNTYVCRFAVGLLTFGLLAACATAEPVVPVEEPPDAEPPVVVKGEPVSGDLPDWEEPGWAMREWIWGTADALVYRDFGGVLPNGASSLMCLLSEVSGQLQLPGSTVSAWSSTHSAITLLDIDAYVPDRVRAGVRCFAWPGPPVTQLNPSEEFDAKPGSRLEQTLASRPESAYYLAGIEGPFTSGKEDVQVVQEDGAAQMIIDNPQASYSLGGIAQSFQPGGELSLTPLRLLELPEGEGPDAKTVRLASASTHMCFFVDLGGKFDDLADGAWIRPRLDADDTVYWYLTASRLDDSTYMRAGARCIERVDDHDTPPTASLTLRDDSDSEPDTSDPIPPALVSGWVRKEVALTVVDDDRESYSYVGNTIGLLSRLGGRLQRSPDQSHADVHTTGVGDGAESTLQVYGSLATGGIRLVEISGFRTIGKHSVGDWTNWSTPRSVVGGEGFAVREYGATGRSFSAIEGNLYDVPYGGVVVDGSDSWGKTTQITSPPFGRMPVRTMFPFGEEFERLLARAGGGAVETSDEQPSDSDVMTPVSESVCFFTTIGGTFSALDDEVAIEVQDVGGVPHWVLKATSEGSTGVFAKADCLSRNQYDSNLMAAIVAVVL